MHQDGTPVVRSELGLVGNHLEEVVGLAVSNDVAHGIKGLDTP